MTTPGINAAENADTSTLRPQTLSTLFRPLSPTERYGWLSFRTEFYNLFNRHYYNINGCYGTVAPIGADYFGQIFGVTDKPRQGQFAIRFEF